MSLAVDMKPREDEDHIQSAWVKALEKTSNRPPAATKEELHDRYQHIMGLVLHIYRHERTNAKRKKPTLPLTDDLTVEYTELAFDMDSCTAIEQEAIQYYLVLVHQREPISQSQRMKLSRYRKKSGLKLDLNY